MISVYSSASTEVPKFEEVNASATPNLWYSTESLPGEIWAQIKSHPRYQVSNYGRIKSPYRILKGSQNPQGYLLVWLYQFNERFGCSIHSRVALAFVDNPDPLRFKEVNHIDGDKLNNRASNLEWVTRSDNLIHARDNGLLAVKLTKEQAEEIRARYRRGNGHMLAAEYNISQTIVSNIATNKIWAGEYVSSRTVDKELSV